MDCEVLMKSTPITKCISYLTRYWNDGLIEFLRNSNDPDIKKQEFRNLVLSYYYRYPERITRLVRGIRNNVISSLIEHPIEFKSLTYNSCNELKDNLLKRNTNHRSIYGAVVTLGAQNTNDGKLFIPVKHNKQYHGNIKEYHTPSNNKGQITTPYTVVFTNNNFISTKSIIPFRNNYIVGNW